MKKMLIAAAFAVTMVALSGCSSTNNCGVCAKPSFKPVCGPCEAKPMPPKPVCAPCVAPAPKPVCKPTCPAPKPVCKPCAKPAPKPVCAPCAKPAPKPVCAPCAKPAPKAVCKSGCFPKFKFKFTCNRCAAPAPKPVCDPCTNSGVITAVPATPAKAEAADEAPAAEEK